MSKEIEKEIDENIEEIKKKSPFPPIDDSPDQKISLFNIGKTVLFSDSTLASFIDTMGKKADTDGDGKTSLREWLFFVIKNPAWIFIALFIYSLKDIGYFIVEGIQHIGDPGYIWDWMELFWQLIIAVVVVIIFIIIRMTDKDKDMRFQEIIGKFQKKIKDIFDHFEGIVDKLSKALVESRENGLEKDRTINEKDMEIAVLKKELEMIKNG